MQTPSEIPASNLKERQKTRFPLRNISFLIFSLCTTIGVFSILFRYVTWADITHLILNIDLGWTAVFLSLSLSLIVFRTCRYRTLLRASGENPPFFALSLVVTVRGMCVDMLPARLGELVYIFLARTRLGIDLGAASASFALAFILDILALGPLLIIAALLLGQQSGLNPTVLLIGGIFFLIVSLGVIAAMIPLLKIARRLIQYPVKKGYKWAIFLDTTAVSVEKSLIESKQKNIFWTCLAWSLLIRLTKYSALYILMFALLVPQGFTYQSLPPVSTFVALVAGEMAASLPISGIGGFGAYEGTMAMVLSMLGFDTNLAAAMTLSHRLLTQIWGLGLGLTALFVLMLPRFRVETANRSDV